MWYTLAMLLFVFSTDSASYRATNPGVNILSGFPKLDFKMCRHDDYFSHSQTWPPKPAMGRILDVLGNEWGNGHLKLCMWDEYQKTT